MEHGDTLNGARRGHRGIASQVPSQPHGAHQFCLASGPSCRDTLPRPRALPRSCKSVPPGHWLNLVT